MCSLCFDWLHYMVPQEIKFWLLLAFFASLWPIVLPYSTKCIDIILLCTIDINPLGSTVDLISLGP